jgi:hypothetical protein
MDEQTKEEGAVQLVAVDSFHTSQTGTVPARAKFETHRAHADDLIKRGLATELGEKQSEPAENKQAPEPENKKAAKPENKAKK